MLFLVATPIGNLDDLGPRAVDTLRSVDYILAEDTRHSRVLLNHYSVSTPLKSYHKFNEAKTEHQILTDLKNGRQLALISDAGTPGIADPGERLVKKCWEHQIPVSGIPGPCACILALSCSGFPTTHFQFLGFLPKTKDHLTSVLTTAFDYPGTTICYESPHRLLDVLEMIHQLEPSRHLCIGRELTKKFEEIKRGTAKELWQHWKTHPLKGECVLLIGPAENEPSPSFVPDQLESLILFLMNEHRLSKKEAVSAAARLYSIPKQTIYKTLS